MRILLTLTALLLIQRPVNDLGKQLVPDRSILYFGASWGSDCLKQEVELQNLEQDYVIIYADIDQDENLAKQYNIDKVPTIIIVDAENKQLARFNNLVSAIQIKQSLIPTMVPVVVENKVVRQFIFYGRLVDAEQIDNKWFFQYNGFKYSGELRSDGYLIVPLMVVPVEFSRVSHCNGFQCFMRSN